MSRDIELQGGLRYTSDAVPGLRRVGAAGRFRYVDAQQKTVRDERTLARIKALAIPPAWREVWISADADAHLQATGRDSRGRKQYRYHRQWRQFRDANKFQRLIDFAQAQPRLRRRIARDLRAPGLSRAKVLAASVRLLEMTLMRIGNDEYMRLNGSFGLTTLRNRHVRINGARIAFQFRGKAGRMHAIEVIDRRLAHIVARCRELPGYELFQYLDEARESRAIGSADVNGYLLEVTGSGYSAKDFRTWGGTLHAAILLRDSPPFGSEAEARRRVSEVVEAVARILGNTPAICRKCYIHPAVIASFLDGSLAQAMGGGNGAGRVTTAGLSADERAVIRLLQNAERRRTRASKRSAAQDGVPSRPASTLSKVNG